MRLTFQVGLVNATDLPHCPPLMGHHAPVADDPRVLRMFHDEGAESPLWDERGTMIWLDQLPLSDDLRSDLSEWAKRADLARYSERDDDSIRDQGLALSRRTQHELGATWRVDWRA